MHMPISHETQLSTCVPGRSVIGWVGIQPLRGARKLNRFGLDDRLDHLLTGTVVPWSTSGTTFRANTKVEHSSLRVRCSVRCSDMRVNELQLRDRAICSLSVKVRIEVVEGASSERGAAAFRFVHGEAAGEDYSPAIAVCY